MTLKLKITGKDQKNALENLTRVLNIAAMIARGGALPRAEVENDWWLRKSNSFLLAPPLGEQDTHTAIIVDESEFQTTLRFEYIWDGGKDKKHSFNSTCTLAIYSALSGNNVEVISE